MMQKGKQNRMSRVSLPQFQGGTLEEYMEVLYSHQKNCEKTGKYMEAETAKRRLMKVKEQLEKLRKEELLGRFEEEKRQVEMAHLQEITEFNRYWDKKMHEYQIQSERMEGDTIDRHQKELVEFEQEIETSLCQGRRETGEIINLRKIEENLVKQLTKYRDRSSHSKKQSSKNGIAQRTQDEEPDESTAEQATKRAECSTSEDRARFRGAEKDETERIRKLIQKYQNFMKELQNQHHQEIIQFEKTLKNQSTMNFSRTQTMSRALHHRN